MLDYGVGNVSAFLTIYRRLNLNVIAASTAADILAASHIILPGVGAFDSAMGKLNSSGLRGALDEAVLNKHTPILGVCVGMQMLADASDEGSLPGLGYIPGRVKLLKPGEGFTRIRVPHMGWNEVAATVPDDKIWRGVDFQSGFYFLHSFYFAPADSGSVYANVHHGAWFAAAVRSRNVFGFQFHPEKSHDNGVALLKNFSEATFC